MSAFKHIKVFINGFLFGGNANICFGNMAMFESDGMTNIISGKPPHSSSGFGTRDWYRNIEYGFKTTGADSNTYFYESSNAANMTDKKGNYITYNAQEFVWSFTNPVDVKKIVFKQPKDVAYNQGRGGLPTKLMIFGSNSNLVDSNNRVYSTVSDWQLIAYWDLQSSNTVTELSMVVGENDSTLTYQANDRFLNTFNMKSISRNPLPVKNRIGISGWTQDYTDYSMFGYLKNNVNELLPFGFNTNSGSEEITGNTTIDTFPVAGRRVYLFDQNNMVPVRRTVSGPNGEYTFKNLKKSKYSVMGIDARGEQNSIIYAHVDLTED